MKGKHVAALTALALAGWAFYAWTQAERLGRSFGSVAREELGSHGWEAGGLLLGALGLAVALG